MSISTGASRDFAASRNRSSSRKAIPLTVFGGVAIAGVVLACAGTLYANVFGTGVYPTVSGANFDAPVIRRPSNLAAQNTPRIAKNVRAALAEPALSSSEPERFPLVASLTFGDRFGAAAPQGVEPSPFAEAPKSEQVSPPPPPAAQVANAVPLPAPRPSTLRLLASREIAKAKAAILSVTASEKPTIFEKLYGKPPSKASALAYASADFGDVTLPAPGKASAMGNAAPYDRSTAVYDISARTVYLPDGTKLEAHSGLGSKLDDPRYVHVKMAGATPPHVYDLQPREALFHGVAALRLKPVDGEAAIFGRTGLLAHTYMLGPNGDSNGCVSFKDYDAFLHAYRNGGIKRLAVVARVE
jgi:Protein of unknown function (DUF2778)